jgi:hypothetical protein
VERCVDGDLGLINPVVPISNEFFDATSHAAKKMIPVAALYYHDLVTIDSCHNGPQTLQYIGQRFGKRRPKDKEPTDQTNSYVRVEQEVYAASAPFVLRPPEVVRLGMCGTPLVRVGNVVDPSVEPSGDVVGFFQWCERMNYNQPSLYCYAECCDPLINKGWVVAEDNLH